MAVRLDPFQDIVNVGWGGRMLVLQLISVVPRHDGIASPFSCRLEHQPFEPDFFLGQTGIAAGTWFLPKADGMPDPPGWIFPDAGADWQNIQQPGLLSPVGRFLAVTPHIIREEGSPDWLEQRHYFNLDRIRLPEPGEDPPSTEGMDTRTIQIFGTVAGNTDGMGIRICVFRLRRTRPFPELSAIPDDVEEILGELVDPHSNNLTFGGFTEPPSEFIFPGAYIINYTWDYEAQTITRHRLV